MRFVSPLGLSLSCETSLGLPTIFPIPESLYILETFIVAPGTEEGTGDLVASVTTCPALEEQTGHSEDR